MQLKLYRSLWGAEGSFEAITEASAAAGFAGMEGGLPERPAERRALAAALKANGLDFIGEICTGGASEAYWVPRREADVAEHLRTFEAAMADFDAWPVDLPFISCMGGLDAWPVDESVRFFEAAMRIAERFGRTVCFETHRTRSLYAPWSTLTILRALPEMLITCDFSHWVVVAERMIDSEPEALAAAAARAHHVQCRVGYPQGPQVADPAAPENAPFLAAHQRWWERVWAAQRERGYTVTTMSPEFGVDGYLQCLPHTRAPVVDLWSVVRWMAETERAHFARFQAGA